jgi:PhnB protein
MMAAPTAARPAAPALHAALSKSTTAVRRVNEADPASRCAPPAAPSFSETFLLGEQAMSRVSTYLNFSRSTEAAFAFYRSVFGSDYAVPIARMGDVPAGPGQPPMSDADKQLVMHVELPILGGHVLMGTDAPESCGLTLTQGNNVHINLEPDTRAEADALFRALSDGGKIDMPLQEMFWGGYFGSLTDQWGIHWMVNCASKT